MATELVKQGATGRRVALAGVITGASELGALAGLAGDGEVIVDAAGIRAFTSSGIQAWLEVMRALSARGVRLVFERCAPAVVRQTMSIHGFLADARVRSVVAPYLCPACDVETSREIAAGAAAEVAEVVPCACGVPAELDDLRAPYEALLRRG